MNNANIQFSILPRQNLFFWTEVRKAAFLNKDVPAAPGGSVLPAFFINGTDIADFNLTGQRLVSPAGLDFSRLQLTKNLIDLL